MSATQPDLAARLLGEAGALTHLGYGGRINETIGLLTEASVLHHKLVEAHQRLLDALPRDARAVAEAIIACTLPDGWSLELDCDAEGYDPRYYLRIVSPAAGSWEAGWPTPHGDWAASGQRRYDTAQELVDRTIAAHPSSRTDGAS